MKKHLLTTFLLCVVTLMTAQERLTPEGLWSFGRVSLYDVAPDGETVLYGVTNYDIAANKGSRDLFLVDKNGKDKNKPRQLTNTPESEGGAQFRPDGKKIGYLRGGYIWEMNPDGSDQVQVSTFQVNGFKYSPKMSHILYIQDVKYKQTTKEIYPDLPKADARIIDDLMYRHWDHWEDESYSNVFVAPYREGEMSDMGENIIGEPFDTPLSPFGGLEQVNWSPDGQKIAYVSKKLTGKEYAVSTNSDVYIYDLKTKKTTNISKGNKGYDLDPVFSPDGKMLAWTSMEKEGYESDRYRIMVMDFNTKASKELTKGWDFNAHSPQWSADGQAMFFTSETQGTQQLFRINLSGEQPSQITIGQHNFYGFVVTNNSLVATKATMSMPHEIFNVGLASGKARQITFTNADQLAKTKMGKVENRTVKTTDGKDMLVWVIYPPDFDKNKQYSALLYCQGGPQSQVSQFWSYRWNFQMMAANDYIIVAPNRRGLPGFGTAWNEEISGDWGGQAQQDLLSAIDVVKKEPYVNEDKLGAVGASYGGYSVYWLAGNHNKRFKSFVSHCGLFNLESWYGSTEESFFANQDIGGAYWEKNAPKSYKEFSPHKYVGNWDTPILVIHGEKDFRVPIGEGLQAFNAAQLQDIPSRFLYFPEEGHWVLTPQNGILWQRVFFEWLARDLKTGGTKP